MSKIKGVDPSSIPSTSKKRKVIEDSKPKAKKTNLRFQYNIPTKNLYDSLSEEEDDTSEEEGTVAPSQHSRIKVPAIVVYSYFDHHVRSISNLQKNLNEELDLKYKGRRIIILTKNLIDYNYVRKELEEAKIQFTTKTPSCDRELKLVIRNLPPNISTDEIMIDLKEKHLPVIKVTQITKKEDNKIIHAYPLFMVTFQKGTDYRTVFQHKKICYCLVQWEKIKRSGVTQCYGCQSFGHIAQNCTRTVRCVICSEEHSTKNCPNREKPPKCTNCGGTHAASFSQCPKRPTIDINRQPPRPRVQRNPTLKNFPSFIPSTSSVNTVPIWPSQPTPQTENPSTGLTDLINIVKSFLQNFDLTRIINNIKVLMSRISVAPDGISKLMIIIDFAASLLG